MRNLYAPITLALFAFAGVFLFIVSGTDSPSPTEAYESPGQSDALKAFDWWYDQRALPNEVIPAGAYQRAAKYLRAGNLKNLKGRAADGVGTDQWSSIGPVNVGGRTLAIAVNPESTNIVWAGSASGGLWKSTTGNASSPGWQWVNTGFPLISVSAIAIDSSNPDVMYVGTGEISRYKRGLVGTSGARSSYGIGIIKSTDGGATWDSTGLTFTFPEITAIERIAINPKNSNTIYAATSEGTFKSYNAGKTWFLSHGVLMAMDVVINPVDTELVYASYGNLNSSAGAGIYFTFDAGDNWIQLQNGLPSTNFGRTPLTISRTDPSILYAGVSDGSSGFSVGIYKTTNSGTSWTLVNPISYTAAQGWYDNVVALDPTNPNHLYISGFSFYESTNGGTTFSSGNGGVHVDHHAITFDPHDPLTIYVGCDGGIYKSSDGGNQFANMNNGYVTTQFYSGVSVSPLDSNLSLGGLQDNGTVMYTGSPGWTPVIGADGGWTAINSQNKNFLYGESQYLSLSRSTNGGGSWSGINAGLPSGSSNANFIPPFTISYSSPNVLYAGGKIVYKTTTGGSSWFPTNGSFENVNGTFISAVAASHTSPDTVMAATGSGAVFSPLFKVFASTNGGAGWTDVTGTLPFRYPTDIEFDPVDSRVAYVTFSGYGSGHIFRTTDVGQSWTDISGNLPNVPHQAITADPDYPSHLYVGTDLGVFYSSDGGAAWEEFSSGMPPAMVLDLVFSRANNSLRAGTFGNGIYQRRIPRTPQVTLTRPQGGELWVAGTIENITWSQKYVSALKIEYSINNGASWGVVTDSVPASFPFFPWIVPSIETSQGMIRITEVGNPAFRDSSNGNFSILVNPEVVSGWNMISLDRNVPDGRKSVLFPTATTNAFSYAGLYVAKDTLVPGTGYWLKYGTPQHISYTGDSLAADTITIRAGWNMIGALTHQVSIGYIQQNPPGILVSPYFGYKNGYFVSYTLDPKRGYWVKSNSAGNLVVVSSALSPRVSAAAGAITDGANELSFSDASGASGKLFFTAGGDAWQSMAADLPPLPPSGAFDVRFGSDRMFETLTGDGRDVPIRIQAVTYPLTIRWKMRSGGAFTLSDAGHPDARLDADGEIVVSELPDNVMRLRRVAATTTAPAAFALEQNYPNPFNPTTKIAFQVAALSGGAGSNELYTVVLKVYDIGGREIATLVNDTRTPGSYTASWDAGAVASGIYFSRLSVTGNGGSTPLHFTATKKMLLVR